MILDGLNDNRGIQVLGTEIASARSEAQHSSDILYHTNGNIYVITSESYSNAVIQRRLYCYRSTDGGNSYTLIGGLTSGSFDVLPSIIQLDTTDNNSDIGVVFLRNNNAGLATGTVYRITVDTDGVLSSGVDPITGSPVTSMAPFVINTGSGYRIFFSVSAITRAVQILDNTSFTTNNWVSFGTINITGVNNECQLRRVRKLSNGDVMALVCARTGLSGSLAGGSFVGENIRSDVFALVSTDNGDTWGTAQNLTNYTGTAGNSKNGIDSALSCDFIELSDGSISVLFQEGKSTQVVSSSTVPSLSVAGGNIGYRQCVYHPIHELLIYCHDSSANGGLFIHKLSDNTVTRLYTGSTPAIWDTRVVSMALSSDGKYLALGTASQGADPASGSVEIIDTTDSNPASWTVTSLRTGSSPATLAERVTSVAFDGSTYDLIFTYENYANIIVGGIVDAETPTSIMTIAAPSGVGNTNTPGGLENVGGYLYGVRSNLVFAIDKTTGTGSHFSAITGLSATGNFPRPIHYIAPTDEFIVFGASTIHRIEDTGSGFSEIGTTLTTSTDPATFSHVTWSPTDSTNIIVAGGSSTTIGIYTGIDNVWYPSIAHPNDLMLGYSHRMVNTQFSELEIDTRQWFVGPDTDRVYRFYGHTGRLRVANYPYSSNQLQTAGVDFYDAVNEVRTGDDFDRLFYPRIHALDDDKIIVSSTRFNITRSTKPKSIVTGIIEPDSQKLQLRACIRANTTRTLDSRARIMKTADETINIGALIVFAQCVYIGARIVPRSVDSVDIKACIKGRKFSDHTMIFSANMEQESSFVGKFYATLNNFYSQNTQIGARIVKQKSNRFTGIFTAVQGNNNKTVNRYNSVSLASSRQSIGVRAGIIK